MKLLLNIFLLMGLSLSASAQELPASLEKNLQSNIEAFEEYAKKGPEEIYDNHYDQTDIMLFMRIDLALGLDGILPKDQINNYKIRLVIALSQIFSESQLEAISLVGNDSMIKKKKTAKYFDVALLLNQGKIKEKSIIKKI